MMLIAQGGRVVLEQDQGSRSKNDGRACGWFARLPASQVRHSRLQTPVAAPPRMSPGRRCVPAGL